VHKMEALSPQFFKTGCNMARKHLYYYTQAGALNRELKREIAPDRLKELHHKTPWRHFAIAFRQVLLLVACPIVMALYPSLWVRIPAGFVMGVVIFSFTVLLHEAVHKCIFNSDPNNLTEKLGFVYGVVSGLAPSQFTRWHMDHHNQLGSSEGDPKRAHLSPKRNARWYKLLYCTPALFPIYFTAAAKAQARYPKPLRKRIKRERVVSMGLHIGWLVFCALAVSPAFAFWASIYPVFFVFPIAFTINRLGQHYIIDPSDVAKWGTLIRPNFLWNFFYLFSSYHLEHHYFPGVPFYKLKALQKELDPFFARRGVQAYSYTRLMVAWFIQNHVAHTKLASEGADSGAAAVSP